MTIIVLDSSHCCIVSSEILSDIITIDDSGYHGNHLSVMGVM